MPRPTFDSLTLAAVADEWQSLRGGHIQRIAQPDAQTVVLSVYAPGRGQTHCLLDGSGRWFRAHSISRRPQSTPSAAPLAFCMALRKYLDGGRIVSISQRGFDRILDLEVRGCENQTYRLVAELIGRNSNLLLVGPDERVLHAARFVPSDKPRPVAPGSPYFAPPPSGRFDPRATERDEFQRLRSDAPEEEFAAWLSNHFEGMSRFLVAEIAARAGDEWNAFESIMKPARENAWQPVALFENEIIVGAYPLPPQSTSAWETKPRETISAALEEYFDYTIRHADLEAARNALQRALQKAIAKRETALSQIVRGVEEGGRADEYRRWAEAILANLRDIAPRQTEVELPNYYADPPANMMVPLDATLSPQENAARYFDRARHVAAHHDSLRLLQSRMENEKLEIEIALEAVGAAQSEDELNRLREEFGARGWLSTQTKSGAKQTNRPNFDGKKVRSFASPDGYTILVGENAEANDYLVQRASAPDDWWLHVRAHAGSHVVIRAEKAPEKVPQSTLFFAARLAAERSAVRHSGVVDVDYTLRKHVRRPRRAAPGQVLISHEKTLRVDLDKG